MDGTQLEAMDDDRTVIVQANFKDQVQRTKWYIWFANLSKLNICLTLMSIKIMQTSLLMNKIVMVKLFRLVCILKMQVATLKMTTDL